MQLTQKESGLLKDLKGQEKICIEKYGKYANDAKDGQLKNLFTDICSVERGHLDRLCKIENGETPSPDGTTTAIPAFTATYGNENTADKQADSYLCSDILSMEKHVSGLYDTCVFEFRDEDLRKVLAGIQRDEQIHGKMIYDYMSANNMYS